MIVERHRSTALNVQLPGIVVANRRPGVIVIIASRVVSRRQTATIGDNENTSRPTITDGNLATAGRAIHDAGRGSGIEKRFVSMRGNEAAAPIARSGPKVVRRLGGIAGRIPGGASQLCSRNKTCADQQADDEPATTFTHASHFNTEHVQLLSTLDTDESHTMSLMKLSSWTD